MADLMPFTKIYTKDYNLQKIQDNVAQALKPLETTPLSQSNLLTGVKLTAGQDNLISHTLDQNPNLWLVAGIDTNATLWSPPSSELQGKSQNDKFINLWTSATCTVNLIVT
jgi:hypothetical protein